MSLHIGTKYCHINIVDIAGTYIRKEVQGATFPISQLKLSISFRKYQIGLMSGVQTLS